jgi:hypothetical protein
VGGQGFSDVKTGLVTGNLEQIGWDKMEALGILGLFSNPKVGGFGSDYCSGNTVDTWKDRAQLIRIAASHCQDKHSAPSDAVPRVLCQSPTPLPRWRAARASE